MFQAYKIVNYNNNFKLIASDLVKDFNELSDEYIYITKNFYVPVNPNCKDEILDYEDGPYNDKEIISEDEYYKNIGHVKKIKY